MNLTYLYRFQLVRMLIGGKWWQYWNCDTKDMQWSREAINGYLPDEDWL
jgi:hypothetical protein